MLFFVFVNSEVYHALIKWLTFLLSFSAQMAQFYFSIHINLTA